MSAPFFTRVAQRYRRPQNFNNQLTTNRKRPHPGFQWRPNTQFGPMNNSNTESNDEHWCETCDRGFPTADLLEQHKQQHQKCNIDGCQFVAHPKVVTRHIQMQHASGLYKKIAKLNNPEEIEKWREERKKKYPTRTNIEKKEAEYKEKVERGEKMGLQQSRSKVDKSTDQCAPRNRSNKPNDYHSTKKSNLNPPPKKIPKPTPKVPSMVEKNILKPFTGILSICMDDDTEENECNLSNSNNNLIEEDEYNEEQIKQPIAKTIYEQPVLCGALSSLMCDYGSSDENDVTVQQQPQKNYRLNRKEDTTNNTNMNNSIEIVESNIKPATDVTNYNVSLNKTNKSQDDSDNDSGPDEVKNVKIDNKEPPYTSSTTSLVTSKRQCDKNNIKQKNRHKPNVPSTLLHKLLRKEIKQERNIVLQCIRHIRKKNFFDNKTM